MISDAELFVQKPLIVGEALTDVLLAYTLCRRARLVTVARACRRL